MLACVDFRTGTIRNLAEGASPCIGKGVGRIPKTTAVGRRRKGAGKLPGRLQPLTIPQPIGLRMICSCLRLDCNFPIADSEVLILLSVGAKRDFNCTRCRLYVHLDPCPLSVSDLAIGVD
jgi:hypothetical protein